MKPRTKASRQEQLTEELQGELAIYEEVGLFQRSGNGKETKLNYLCYLLELDIDRVDHVRYQLLHRIVSALIEAKRFNAPNAGC